MVLSRCLRPLRRRVESEDFPEVTPEVLPALLERRALTPVAFLSPVYVGGGWVEASVYERRDLGPGVEIAGPSIVEQPDTTVLLLPGGRAPV